MGRNWGVLQTTGGKTALSYIYIFPSQCRCQYKGERGKSLRFWHPSLKRADELPMPLVGDSLVELMQKRTKQQKFFAHCNKCHGCHHTLANIDTKTHLFNSTFVNRPGASGAWTFESKFSCDPSSTSKNDENSKSWLSGTGELPLSLC